MMCETKVKTNFYYVNICKYGHENNMTRLWCKIVPKTNVEDTKGNEGSYSYLYPFGNLVQGSFQGYFCVHQVKKFLENLYN
jgi:uncharacterized protein YjaZ